MTIGLNKNKSIYQPILSQIKIPLKQPGGAVSNKEDYFIFTHENNHIFMLTLNSRKFPVLGDVLSWCYSVALGCTFPI